MDDLHACPPSVLKTDGELRMDEQNDAAALGSVCHGLCASMVDTGDYDLGSAAIRNGLPDSDAEAAVSLMSYANRTWTNEIGRYFPRPQVEASVVGPELEVDDDRYQVTGTIDVCSPVGRDKVVFADWKSGYVDDGYYEQMACYAYLLWNFIGRPTEITIVGIVVFLRSKTTLAPMLINAVALLA